MIIAIFGCGNIGRGLIPEVFGNQHTYYFIDINQEIIEKINKQKKYQIIKNNQIPYEINKIKGFNLEKDKKEIEATINDIDIITTAVGLNNLDYVANFINSLNLTNLTHKIDFICFENNIRPSSYIAKLINDSHKFNFIDAVVDRIVPKSNNQTLNVICESFYKVVIEDKAISNKEYYQNFILTKNLESYIQTKLYLVNGLHFIIAVLGYNNGYKKIHLTLQDKEINNTLKRLSHIYQVAISNITNLKQDVIKNYFNESIKRFKQEFLNDDNTRIARNMILKLRYDNRIVPIYNALNEKADKQFFLDIIKQLYHYDNPNDEDAKIIQKSIQNIGIKKTILKYSNIKI